MALLNWIFGRKPAAAVGPAENMSVMMGDETRPLVRGHDGWVEPPQAHHFSAPTPKPEQLENREQLYSVVRESMTHAGVLSASYKFKVLSLDRRGTRFLVMVDVARAAGGDTARLSEIEVLMAQTCKARHGIQVTAVYWRMHDHVAVGVPQRMAVPKAAPAPVPASTTRPRPDASAVVPVRTRPDAVAADEVAAFRQALAGGSSADSSIYRQPARPVAGATASVPRQAPGWESDERAGRDAVPPGLGTTQYGELQ